MAQVPLGVGAYSRPFGKMPEIRMENRFFEENPIGAEKTSLLSRPGTKLFLEVGDGPIRTLFAQPGVFDGDLFIVSGTKLFRYDGETVTPIEGDVLGAGFPVMTGVAIIGWEAVFITDGVTLQYYEGSSRAEGILSIGAPTVEDDLIQGVRWEFALTFDERNLYVSVQVPIEADYLRFIYGDVEAEDPIVDGEYSREVAPNEPGELLEELLKESNGTTPQVWPYDLERSDVTLQVEAWDGVPGVGTQIDLQSVRVSHASGLVPPGAPAENEVVQIGTVFYRLTSGDVNAGTQNGSSSAPWLVKIGLTNRDTLANLFDAINLTGVAGTNYGDAVTAHPQVRATSLTDTSFKVRAIESGEDSNAIVTTASGETFFWGSGTLSGGGSDHVLKLCSVPDDVVISDLATLASFVICVESNSRRFFWIRPGEVDIDPLDFSSAESEPDYIVNVVTVGDQFWLLGQSSTEAWYASGDGDQPFLRTQGRAFSQGILPGTVARVQESIMVVGQDRVAYRIAGSPERISHHGIEERIRLWQEQLAAQ